MIYAGFCMHNHANYEYMSLLRLSWIQRHSTPFLLGPRKKLSVPSWAELMRSRRVAASMGKNSDLASHPNVPTSRMMP